MRECNRGDGVRVPVKGTRDGLASLGVPDPDGVVP